MSYVVLARKWRPQTFDDLVGQEHVSRTLANAIASDRVAHAFLFTGVRGVGKTTSARILAKALNCEQGPTATPCLKCHACVEIGEGMDVDVQEIDGASYTGVDAVRSLQETIPYRPARDRFKIYIVDEVHMLSTAAWNAFLKTLEEPPPHVKFIFATTEVNKVPVTILSRCQRYDFKLIRTGEIAARLCKVLDAEKVEADDEATRIIAREAAGSMRDAMSLLDQVIAWVGGGQKLTAEGVSLVLGVAARSVLHRLSAAVIDGNAAQSLTIVEQLAEQGYSLANVARDFLEQLRDLVVAKVSDKPEQLIAMADEELRDVVALAGKTSEDDLSRLYLGFSRAFDDIARSAQPRSALEMALVRLARRPPLVPLDELMRRLAELEQRLASDERGGSGAAGGGKPGGPPRRDPSASPPRQQRPQQGAPHQSAPRASEDFSRFQPPRRAEPAAPVEQPKAPSPSTGSPNPSSPHAGSPIAAPPMVAEQLGHWEAILARVRADKASLASVFEHAAPLSIASGRIVLAYEAGSFLAEQASETEAQSSLAAASTAHFGERTVIEIDLTGRQREVESLAARNSAAQAARIAEAKQKVAEHPLVLAAVSLLGAELREVRLPGDTA